MKENSGIAVIGLGNYLMGDEGVGVHVIQNLQKNYSFTPPIQLIDGGTTGMDLLEYFEENDHIIIIDAVIFNKYPGYMEVIRNEEILKLITNKISLHQLGLKDLLSYLKLTDSYPAQLVLVGIQPLKIKVGTVLSTILTKVMPNLLETVFSILRNWGINIQKRHDDNSI